MNTENSIFQMPFDESDGALTAYDYSPNRADGVVTGAHFGDGGRVNIVVEEAEAQVKIRVKTQKTY